MNVKPVVNQKQIVKSKFQLANGFIFGRNRLLTLVVFPAVLRFQHLLWRVPSWAYRTWCCTRWSGWEGVGSPTIRGAGSTRPEGDESFSTFWKVGSTDFNLKLVIKVLKKCFLLTIVLNAMLLSVSWHLNFSNWPKILPRKTLNIDSKCQQSRTYLK